MGNKFSYPQKSLRNSIHNNKNKDEILEIHK